MTEKVVVIASGLAAFLASLCCLGPLLLGGIGLGVALAATFESLRPYFLGLTAVLLALGFYLAYRKPKAAVACADEACSPATGRVQRLARPFLWVAAFGVLALALFPVYGARLVSSVKHPASPAPVSEANLAHVALQVSGMSCEICAISVKTALTKLPGVAEAQVDIPGGAAHVRYDPAQVKPAQLIKAVNSTGFKASL